MVYDHPRAGILPCSKKRLPVFPPAATAPGLTSPKPQREHGESQAPGVPQPEGTHSNDTYQARNKIFLRDVHPEKGPTTGGTKIVILGKHFPSTPLYVVFGGNWIRAVSHTDTAPHHKLIPEPMTEAARLPYIVVPPPVIS